MKDNNESLYNYNVGKIFTYVRIKISTKTSSLRHFYFKSTIVFESLNNL